VLPVLRSRFWGCRRLACASAEIASHHSIPAKTRAAMKCTKWQHRVLPLRLCVAVLPFGVTKMRPCGHVSYLIEALGAAGASASAPHLMPLNARTSSRQQACKGERCSPAWPPAGVHGSRSARLPPRASPLFHWQGAAEAQPLSRVRGSKCRRRGGLAGQPGPAASLQ